MVNVLGTLTCPKNEERWDGNSIGSGVRIQSCTNRQLRTFGKDIWLSINSCQVLLSILGPYTDAWLIFFRSSPESSGSSHVFHVGREEDIAGAGKPSAVR